MILINQAVIDNSLDENDGFLDAYEEAANALFRANDSRSVRCLSIWALKRRHIHKHPFEQRVMSKYNLQRKWARKAGSNYGEGSEEHSG